MEPQTLPTHPYPVADPAPGPLYIGIDPGASGAVAVLDAAGQIVSLHDQPDTPVEFAELVRLVTCGRGTTVIAALESISWRGPFGARGNFVLGGFFMAWQTALAVTGTPCHLLTPAKWRQILDTPKPNPKSSTYGPKALKLWVAEYVARIWPDAEIKTPRGRLLDGRADAICIAEALRRKLTGSAGRGAIAWN